MILFSASTSHVHGGSSSTMLHEGPLVLSQPLRQPHSSSAVSAVSAGSAVSCFLLPLSAVSRGEVSGAGAVSVVSLGTVGSGGAVSSVGEVHDSTLLRYHQIWV